MWRSGGYQLVMPVDSARTISDAAEIINHLGILRPAAACTLPIRSRSRLWPGS
jgi:hypothetical protein